MMAAPEGPGTAAPIPALARGRAVASALGGSWRPRPPALALSQAALEGIAPLALATGAAGLIWWRVHDPALRASPAASRLQAAYRLQATLAAVHEHQLQHAVTLLRSAGAEPVLMKGWAAARLYPRPGLRPYGDLDLCVRPGQYATARAALASATGKGCPVDLHAGVPLLPDRSLEDLYGRSRVDTAGGAEVRVLGAEDHLRLLCLHLLDHGAWRPLWLCDVAAAVEALPAGFDWDYFLGGSARRADWATCALGLARDLLGARLGGTPTAVSARKLPPWLLPAVLRQWGAPRRQREPLLFRLRLRAGVWEGLRDSWPDPITATLGVGGPINRLPRLPFQIAQCFKRSAQIAAELLAPRTP
jgi:hypothetical protein